MLRDVSSSTERVFATMKSLLLCLFVGLAFASTVVKDSAFVPGTEYRYRYDTQLMTGLAHTSKIYSGFRLRCHARVQFVTYSKVRVQFEDVTFYRVNDPVHQEHPQQRLLPLEYLKEAVGEEAEIMADYLQAPFGFSYYDGIVVTVAIDDKETEWSANIKRGFMGLFQMNLNRKMEIKESVQTRDASDPKYVHFFQVMEESTLGACATHYTVNSADETGNVYVTKSRDFKKCLGSPYYFKSIWQYQEKSNYLKDEPLLQEANMKYTIRGTSSSFIIMSAVSEGRVLFSPYNNQGEIMTNLNQTMYLRSSKAIDQTEVIPDVSDCEKRDSLRMTLPSESVDPQDPFNLKTIEPKQSDKAADVYQANKILMHLKLAAEDTLKLTSQQSLTHLRVVADMLKTSPREIVSQMWLILNSKQAQDDVSLVSRKIMWNLMPHVATDDIANFVLDICTKDLTMADNCTYAINQLALRVTPTESIINKLIVLTDERLRVVPANVKQAGYLALGSLGYKLNLENKRFEEYFDRSHALLKAVVVGNERSTRRFVTTHKRRNRSQRNKINSSMRTTQENILLAIDRLFATPSFDDKVLALKAIANSGLQEGISRLTKYITNPAEPQILRLMAICGYRRMNYPEESRRLAIGTLRMKVLDTSEKSEVRNMAFAIMSGLKPELSTYEVIADYLRSEKDKHVSSFILDSLRSYANSTFPPHHEMRKNATAALLLAPHEKKPDMTSFVKEGSAFDAEYKLGGSWRFGTIGDRNGYKGMALSLDTYVLGYLSEFLEVGLNTEGMSRIFDKLFGPQGLLSHKKSIFDLLKRMPRDLTPQQKIDEIFKLLRISPRTSAAPYGHLYFKIMGHEIRYLDFTAALRHLLNEDKIPVSIKDTTLKAGLPIDINTMFSHFESQLTLATECGIPLSLKFQVQSALNVKGTVQFQVGPQLLEKERESKPPVVVYAAIDLTPKVILGVRGSVVIDMFYYKPVVGFNGIFQAQHPLRMDLTLDLAYNKLQFNNYMQPRADPVVEMIIQPFTQFQVIDAKDLNPILHQVDNAIYAPHGARIRPISRAISLDFLGYQLLLSGQAPTYLSRWNAIRPMNGRYLLNAFMKPTDTAARLVTLNAQVVHPEDVSEVTPVYDQTYRRTEFPTRKDEEEHRDRRPMRPQEERKYDLYGKPMPSLLPEEIIPHSDPINLNKQRFTIEELLKKFKNITGKPSPFYNTKNAIGLVLTLDASYETSQRHLQLETVFTSLLEEKYNVLLSRFWRSALPGVDAKTFQVFLEHILAFPLETFEPKDIYDPRKQTQIMNDLQTLVSLDTHKVLNQILNLTVLTQAEQVDYLTLRQAVDDRTTRNMITEQLYVVMNTTGMAFTHRQWELYWEDLVPLMREVTEDRRMKVERSYERQDAIILEQLTKLQRVQSRFLSDLDTIVSSGMVSHAELPVLQAVNHYQTKTAYVMQSIVEKCAVKGLLASSYELVKERLDKVLENIDIITQKVTVMYSSVETVSQEVTAENRPIVVFRAPVKPESDRRPIQRPDEDILSQHSSYDSDDSEESRDEINRSEVTSGTLAELMESLYYMTHSQVDLIQTFESAIHNREEVESDLLLPYIMAIHGNITLFDEIFAAEQTPFEVVKDSIMLVTVQNDYLTMLYEEYIFMKNDEKRPEGNNTNKVLQTDYEQNYKLVMKVQGFYLAERTSSVFAFNMYEKTILPYLHVEEVPIYRKLASLVSELIPQVRSYEVSMAYNFTAMRIPEVVSANYNSAISKMDTWITKALEIQKEFRQLQELPQLTLVSKFTQCIDFMKHMTEFVRQSLLSLKDSQRLVWIEKLNQQSTTIQSLMSSMSTIYTKYTEENEEAANEFKGILPRVPVNIKILDLQDVRVRQKMLHREIEKYIRNPDISNTDLTEILKKAIDRISRLQDVLKRDHREVLVALDETKFHHRESISATYTEVLYHQSSMYDIVQRTLSSRRDRVYDASQLLDRISNLKIDLSEMRNEKDRKMTDIRAKDIAEVKISRHYSDEDSRERYQYDDSPRYVDERISEDVQKPVYSSVDVAHGVEGFLNITWGENEILDKQFRAEFLATRTVEQMLGIFEQINNVARSSDISKAIDDRLSGETWKNDAVLKKLNSFNHWHLVAHYDKTTLPEWTLSYGNYLQEYLKYRYWDQYSQQPAQSFLEEGELHTILDISDSNRQSDLYVMTNSETDRFMGLQQLEAFKYVPKYEPYKVSKPRHYNSKCILNKNKVFTMDQVSYELPPQIPKCKNVLAMDCTIDKAFAMTIVEANTTYEAKNLLILAGSKEIEIIPGELSTAVKVDGRYLLLEDNKPIAYNRNVHYGQETPVVILKRTGLLVEVELPLYGVYASLEGDYIQVETSRLYHKKLCGLCSNYDRQMSWEFEGPRKELYTTPSEFAYSYILREGQCPINARPLDAPYRPKGNSGRFVNEHPTRQQAPVQPSEDAQCQIERRTDVIDDETDAGLEVTCFSTKSIKECPLSCPPSGNPIKEKVLYICLRRDSEKVQELLAQTNDVLDFSNLTKADVVVSHKKEVTQQTQCKQLLF